MPSLRVLEQFKSSFNELGGEMAAMAALNQPFDDLPLPDVESADAAGEIPGGGSSAPSGGPDVDFEGISGLDSGADPDFSFDDFTDSGLDSSLPAGDAIAGDAGADDAAAGTEDAALPEAEPATLDFGAFLDTIPDDLALPSADEGFETPPDIDTEAASAEAPIEAAAEVPAAAPMEDDFGIPDGLLDGLANDVDSGPADFDEELPVLEASEDDGAPPPDADRDLPPDDFAGSTAPEEPSMTDAMDFSSPEDLSAPDEAPDFDFSIDEGEGFDLGGSFEETPKTSGDTFDSFSLGDLGGEFNEAGAAAGSNGTAADAPGAGGSNFDELEEFSLPGIDDVFTGTAAGKTAGITGSGAGTKAAPDGASGEVEEIQLTDEELAQFRRTLSEYPLNLRIACEELIVEQAVAPDLMSRLVKLLIKGASAKETAALAGKILGRSIPIPKGFEKKTGEELEAEQSSFAYIFVHNFLPALRFILVIGLAAASLCYLVYEFVYTPLLAESIYKAGYKRLGAGEFERANERFDQAFGIHRKKNWFYTYAEGFRGSRQYLYAEEKYDELLRFYPRDKKGVMDYASMETWELRNYEKADALLRRNILDYAPNDRDALLALGDNALEWGGIDRGKYEDARFAYARLLDKYGWTDPVVERMMKYFIRTDNLKETIPLQNYFMNNRKRKISAESLAELGGYLLDKRLEEVRGVPSEYVELIEGVREVLLKAVRQDPSLPESHYHLSRYYGSLGNTHEEEIALKTALDAFDNARQETVRRLSYRLNGIRRYAEIQRDKREFFPAGETLIKGVNLYDDALSRRLISPSPEFGRLYAGLGDLEYFTKDGDMETALRYYERAERDGWAPPEIQYRMGAAHYQLGNWPRAMERFFFASERLPLNRRLLYALGNVSYRRGNYFAAQGYYNRLLDILENERSRLPLLLPNEKPEYVELAERLMVARNNMGAVLEALSGRTGDIRYRSRAQALYTESARAWDALTRNPETMTRMTPTPEIRGPGVNPAYLNIQNSLYPVPGYEPQFFTHIDKDVLEPSAWEELAPLNYRLSEGVFGSR